MDRATELALIEELLRIIDRFRAEVRSIEKEIYEIKQSGQGDGEGSN